MSTLRRIVCLTIASTAMFPGAALASDWSPAATLPTSANGSPTSGPLIESDAAGNQTVVWTDAKGVRSAVKPAGGAWGASTQIAATYAGSIALDVSPNGHAIVAWTSAGTQGTAVTTVTRTPAGVWSAPTTAYTSPASPVGSYSEPLFDFDIGSTGAISGASILKNYSGRNYQTVTYGDFRPVHRPEAGDWTPTGSVVGVDAAPYAVEVAIDGRGFSTLLIDDADGSLKTATRAIGAWSAATTLVEAPDLTDTDSGGPYAPTLSVDPAGRAVVAFARYESGNTVVRVLRRTENAGSWLPLATIDASPKTGFVDDLDAQLDASGRATVVWNRWFRDEADVHRSQILSASARPGDAWPAPQAVVPSKSIENFNRPYDDLRLAVAGDGKALLTWERPELVKEAGPESTTEIDSQVAVRQGGGTFEPAETLIEGQVSDQVARNVRPAIGPSGEATVVWSESSSLKYRTLAAASPAPTPTPVPTPTPTPSPNPVATPSISTVGGIAYGWLGGIALINGKHFTDVTAVRFGAKKATTGFAVGTGMLVVVAPPQEAGTYPVTVETKAGVSAPVNFTYKRLF